MPLGRYGSLTVVLLGISVLLSCGSSNNASSDSSAPSTQVLYIITDGTVTTYSVDHASLAATPVEQPVSLLPAGALLMQFTPAPHDQFVYAVWSDGQNLQHLSVFATDSSGVPQLPAFQVLNANSLSQFNMHPSGRFAYMLEVTSSSNQYVADIRLFTVQPGLGTLKENSQIQGTYGPEVIWPAFLFGFSTDGSKLYDTSTLITGPSVYRQRPINLSSGALGRDKQILEVTGRHEVILGKVIVYQSQGSNATQKFLDVYPNTPNPAQATIRCTSEMLSFCATATNVQLDKTGHYLFFTDPATQAVHVGDVNLTSRKIRDTAASMPMTSQTPGYAFSPDGSIVYAILKDDQSLHFYHFDATTGSLTEAGTPLPIPSGSGFCPARYQ